MPEWDELFLLPYNFILHHRPVGGNVRRALVSTNRVIDLNGHTNRYFDESGGAYQSLLCENLVDKYDSISAIYVNGYDWFAPTLTANPHHSMPIFASFGHTNIFPVLFSHLFRPTSDILDVTARFRAIFHRSYVIGVQIRSILRFPKENEHWIWRAMLHLQAQAEARQDKPVMFYVCTDTLPPWNRLLRVFGEERLMSASIQDGFIGRSSQKDVMYGVIDMLLLGECDDIILSPESTFGGVAAARVGAQPWRVTKNPVNSSDSSWDSVRIVARAAGQSPCSYGWQFVPRASCFSKCTSPSLPHDARIARCLSLNTKLAGYCCFPSNLIKKMTCVARYDTRVEFIMHTRVLCTRLHCCCRRARPSHMTQLPL